MDSLLEPVISISDFKRSLGVETVYEGNSILLKKIENQQEGATQLSGSISEPINLDLANAPDIAQTIAVTCFGLGIGCHLTGLHTLKIKETDRLEALHTEMSKLGADILVTEKSLTLRTSSTIKKEVAIDTYNDHRMAMAFAPLALKTSIIINDAEVVSKSYPDFWKDLEIVGIPVKNL